MSKDDDIREFGLEWRRVHGKTAEKLLTHDDLRMAEMELNAAAVKAFVSSTTTIARIPTANYLTSAEIEELARKR